MPHRLPAMVMRTHASLLHISHEGPYSNLSYQGAALTHKVPGVSLAQLGEGNSVCWSQMWILLLPNSGDPSLVPHYTCEVIAFQFFASVSQLKDSLSLFKVHFKDHILIP